MQKEKDKDIELQRIRVQEHLATMPIVVTARSLPNLSEDTGRCSVSPHDTCNDDGYQHVYAEVSDFLTDGEEYGYCEVQDVKYQQTPRDVSGNYAHINVQDIGDYEHAYDCVRKSSVAKRKTI